MVDFVYCSGSHWLSIYLSLSLSLSSIHTKALAPVQVMANGAEEERAETARLVSLLLFFHSLSVCVCGLISLLSLPICLSVCLSVCVCGLISLSLSPYLPISLSLSVSLSTSVIVCRRDSYWRFG